jgi:predicted RNase H-like HicB family nuclease
MKRKPSAKYAVVIEKSKNGYGAYVPDFPGCVALGDTPAEVQKLIIESIELHIEGLREDGIAIPQPTTRIEYVSARVA